MRSSDRWIRFFSALSAAFIAYSIVIFLFISAIAGVLWLVGYGFNPFNLWLFVLIVGGICGIATGINNYFTLPITVVDVRQVLTLNWQNAFSLGEGLIRYHGFTPQTQSLYHVDKRLLRDHLAVLWSRGVIEQREVTGYDSSLLGDADVLPITEYRLYDFSLATSSDTAMWLETVTRRESVAPLYFTPLIGVHKWLEENAVYQPAFIPIDFPWTPLLQKIIFNNEEHASVRTMLVEQLHHLLTLHGYPDACRLTFVNEPDHRGIEVSFI